MPSLLMRCTEAKKGCPFCNFEPCRTEKCMFFIAPPGRDFDCALFMTFTDAAASAAFAQHIDLLLGLQPVPGQPGVDPALLTDTHDRLEEILESLESVKWSPVLSAHARAKIDRAWDAVATSRREVKTTLDTLSLAKTRGKSKK